METENIDRKLSSRIIDILTKPAVSPLIALILACIFFSFQHERFLTGRNISLILQQVMVVGTLAIGQTLIIITRGIDLSNGMVMVFSAIIMTSMAVHYDIHPLLAVGLGLISGVSFSALNGFLITRFRLPPFIVTLGMWNIVFALVRIYTIQTVTSVPYSLTFLGDTFMVGNTSIAYGTLLVLGLYLIMWYVLQKTPAGRHIYALGDNPEAARLSGIRTDRLLIGVYILAGVFYTIAGLLLVGRTGVGDPQAGQIANLESITAVVLGGTSLFGGRGHIMGTLIGVLIVGVFRNGLQLMGIPSIYQVLITGILVILAVSVDQISRTRRSS